MKRWITQALRGVRGIYGKALKALKAEDDETYEALKSKALALLTETEQYFFTHCNNPIDPENIYSSKITSHEWYIWVPIQNHKEWVELPPYRCKSVTSQVNNTREALKYHREDTEILRDWGQRTRTLLRRWTALYHSFAGMVDDDTQTLEDFLKEKTKERRTRDEATKYVAMGLDADYHGNVLNSCVAAELKAAIANWERYKCYYIYMLPGCKNKIVLPGWDALPKVRRNINKLRRHITWAKEILADQPPVKLPRANSSWKRRAEIMGYPLEPKLTV